MDNFLLEKLRKNKFISYLLIMVQFLFPTVLSLTPTVHAYASATENKNTNSERWLAQQASQAGAILSSENSKDSASQYFFNQANNKINQEVENWLSQYGKAQINLGVDKNFTLKNTEAKIIIPLYENNNYLLFNQTTFHRSYDRNQGNIGFGIRKFDDTQLYGFNTHFDHDFTGNNSRIGIGLEYRRDYFSVSSNYYNRLTGWKDSSIKKGYDERPANGWDIRTQSYLPAYPQLGLKANFEQYYGDNVDLFNNTSNLTKDPFAFTAGLNYTPFPLITFNAEHKLGKGGDNDTQLSLSLNYQFGTPIKTQLDPSNIKPLRLLENSKYDFVDRNNNIVFDYKEQTYLSLKTPDLIEGYSNEQKVITISVESSAGLDYIDVNGADFIQNGGKIIKQAPNSYLLYLPYYNQQKGATNTYNIVAIAYDKKGRSSSPETTKIVVLKDNNAENATISATPQKIGIDESSIITLSFTNHEGELVEINDARIVLDNGVNGVLSDTQYNAKNKTYQAKFIGVIPETARFYAFYNQVIHQDISTTVSVEKNTSRYQQVTLKADKNAITLGNSTLLRLTFFDKNKQPIEVDNAQILLTNSEQGDISNTTYDPTTKQYTATFVSKNVGDAIFQPSLNNEVISDVKEIVNVSTFKNINLTTVNEMYVGDSSKVVMTILDDNNQPMEVDNAKIQMIRVNNQTGNGVISETIYNAADKNYSAQFQATETGKVTFYPYVANTPYPDSKAETSILSHSEKYKIVSLTAEPEQIIQNQTSVITAVVQDNQGQPVTDKTVEIVLITNSGTLTKTTKVSGKAGVYQATYTGTEPTTATFTVNVDDIQNNDTKVNVIVWGRNDVNATLVANNPSLDLTQVEHNSLLTLTLTDKNNNPLPTDNAVILQEQPNYGILDATKKISATQYTANFNATKVGTAKFFVELEGFRLKTTAEINVIDSKPTIDLNNATIASNPSHIYSTEEKQNGHTRSNDNNNWRTSTITLDIKDQYGNLFSPDVPIDIVIKNTQNGRVSEAKEVKPGEYQVVYTPTEQNIPFTATFYAVINNVQQNQISTTVDVEPLIHNVKMGASLIPIPSHITVGNASILNVIFYQDNKPYIPSGTVEIRLADDSKALGHMEATTKSGHIFQAKFIGENVGKANFEIFVDKQQYTEGNINATVNVTESYRGKLNAEPSSIPVKQTSVLTLQIQNHLGQSIKVSDDDVQIIMLQGDGNTAEGTISETTYDANTKSYQATFTGTKQGKAQFISIIDGQTYNNTSTTVTVKPAYNSANMGRETSPITLNKTSDVYLTLLDASGQPIQVDNAKIMLNTPNLGSLTVTTWDNTNKRYVATFTGSAIGNAEFSAYVDNQKIADVTTSIQVNDSPDAFYNPSLVPSPSVITVNNKSEIRLTIQDINGLPIKGNSANIILETPTLGSLSETVWDESINAYKATFTGNQVGKANFSAIINGKVGQAKTSVQVNEVYNSATLQPDPSTILSGDTSELTLTLFDKSGEQVRITNDNVSINILTPKLGSLNKTTFDAKTKTYKAKFNSAGLGTAQFNVSINGIVRSDITASIIIKKAYESASLTAMPSSIYTGKTSELTLTFKDANNKPIEVNGAKIILRDGEAGQLTDTTYNEAKKVYTATFTGTLATNANFNASINNNIDTSIKTTVTVKELSLDSFNYQLISKPNSIYINDESTLELKITDANGAVVQLDDVSIAQSSNNQYGTLSKTTYNSKTGTYTATFTGKNVGTETFYVVIQQTVLSEVKTTVTVDKVIPITDIAYIDSNNYSFELNEGFPTTGYQFSSFSFVMKNGTKASDYTWKANQSWVTLTQNSNKMNVMFSKAPNSENKTVTITAQPRVEGVGTAFSYTFTLKRWFTFYGGQPLPAPRAWKICTDNGLDTTPSSLLTSGTNKRGIGTVFSEWGKGGSVFHAWSSDINDQQQVGLVNLYDGSVKYLNSYFQYDPVCKTDL